MKVGDILLKETRQKIGESVEREQTSWNSYLLIDLFQTSKVVTAEKEGSFTSFTNDPSYTLTPEVSHSDPRGRSRRV